MEESPHNPSQGYLLDTSIISVLAPERQGQVTPAFAYWLQAHSAQLYLPSIAVVELAQGIAKLHRSGSVARAERLDQWLDGLVAGYGKHILALDAPAAQLAGRISDAATAAGRHPGFADVAIAALARHYDLTLLTHNTKHFAPLGVVCEDPLVIGRFQANEASLLEKAVGPRKASAKRKAVARKPTSAEGRS